MHRITVCSLTFVLCLSCSSGSHGAAWDRLGPNGGRINSLCVARTDQRIVYAAGAFVFRSTDGGAHWTRTTDVFPACGPESPPPLATTIVVSPKDANRAAVSSPQGLFLTTNGGGTWNRAGGIAAYVSAAAFSLDGRRLYASVGETLYRSMNSGDTWDSVPMPNFVALCGNFQSGFGFVGARALPDATGKSIYRTDDGSGWYPLASIGGVSVAAMQPSMAGDVYVASSDSTGGVWQVSKDGVATNVYGSPVTSLCVSSTTPACVLAAPCSGSPAVVRTFTAGADWEPLRTGFASREALSVALGPGLAPLAGTGRGGVLACDASNVWRPTNTGLAMASLTGACQSASSARILVAAAGDGLYRSANDGDTWALCHPSTQRSVMAQSPARAGRVWHTGAEGIEKSDDNGQTWQHFTTGLSATVDILRIVPHPTQENNVWIVTAGGAVYQNTTGNPNWVLRLAAWPSTPTSAPDVLISPVQPATIYATRTDGLYHSMDSGAHWALLTTSLPAGALLCAHPTDANVLYQAYTLGATVWLSRSDDGGATWTPTREETGAADSAFAATFLAADRRAPGRILLGTNRGLRISDNGGSTWRVEPIGSAGAFTTGWAPYGTTGDLVSTEGAGLLRCRPVDHSTLSALDALRVLHLAISPNLPSPTDLAFGDLNEDGHVTPADADLALRSATGP